LIGDVLDGLENNPQDNRDVEQKVAGQVKALCARFPLYR
jgi:glycine/serine hydroxymethyltransferase